MITHSITSREKILMEATDCDKISQMPVKAPREEQLFHTRSRES